MIPGPDSPKWLFDSPSRLIAQSAYGLHREIHVWPALERRLMPGMLRTFGVCGLARASCLAWTTGAGSRVLDWKSS